MHILVTLLIGLVVGVIAKFLMPGRDPGGFIIARYCRCVRGALDRNANGLVRAYGRGGIRSIGWRRNVVAAVVSTAVCSQASSSD